MHNCDIILWCKVCMCSPRLTLIEGFTPKLTMASHCFWSISWKISNWLTLSFSRGDPSSPIDFTMTRRRMQYYNNYLIVNACHIFWQPSFFAELLMSLTKPALSLPPAAGSVNSSLTSCTAIAYRKHNHSDHMHANNPTCMCKFLLIHWSYLRLRSAVWTEI